MRHRLRADVEQYLTVQVSSYLRAHLPAERGQLPLTIAGLSEGGMCAAMLALRHPSEYPLFGDMSGLGRPTVGRTDDPTLTVRDIFGGSAAAYDAHDPLWILARQKFPGVAGWFTCGSGDAHTCGAQRSLAPAARAAGRRGDHVGRDRETRLAAVVNGVTQVPHLDVGPHALTYGKASIGTQQMPRKTDHSDVGARQACR